MGPRDQIDIYNDTDDPLPAGGLCQWAGGVTSQGAVKVVKPAADSAPNLIVAGPHGVPPRAGGLGTFAPSVVVAFDPTGGAPAVGDALGSQVGSFLAKKGHTGFVCYAGANGPWALCVRPQSGVTPPAYDNVQIESSYTITTNNVWQDVDTLDLPEAGQYVVWANANGVAEVSALGGADYVQIAIRLALADAVRVSTPLLPSSVCCYTHAAGEYVSGSGFVWTVIEVSAATALKLQAQRTYVNLSGAGPTWAHSLIAPVLDGVANERPTELGWLKVGGGAQGPPGAPGATGAPGADGADGATNPEAENAVVGLQVFGP